MGAFVGIRHQQKAPLCALVAKRHQFRHLQSAVASGEETATWAPPAALEAILVLLHA